MEKNQTCVMMLSESPFSRFWESGFQTMQNTMRWHRAGRSALSETSNKIGTSGLILPARYEPGKKLYI